MISPLVKYLARHLFFILIVVLVFFFYPCVTFGMAQGILVGFLTWSLYILALPAAHGYYVFGSFARFIGLKQWHPEPVMFLAAIILNVVVCIVFRPIYKSTFFTIHLFRIITKPNPYWLMVVISSLGTLYPYLVGEQQFNLHYRYHRNIRLVLIAIGIVSFFYFSWQDLVMLLNDLV